MNMHMPIRLNFNFDNVYNRIERGNFITFETMQKHVGKLAFMLKR